jgi:ribonuclease HI
MEEGQAIAYVDGSFNVTTGEYGCGVVFFYEGRAEFITEKGADENYAAMQNVAGEMLGAQRAMERAVSLKARKLTLYYDFKGIASWCLGDWKTNKEATTEYKLFYISICHLLDITFQKVKGHSGDFYNDLADELAKEAAGVI